jgi:prophage tail gpP-like protein
MNKPRTPITIKVQGVELHGWLESTVSRSLEDISGTFSIPVSFDKGDTPKVFRQDEVEVLIGGHVVIAGYVLSAEPFYFRDDVGLRITGRDYTGDLVVASAIYKGGQWLKTTVDQIARDLCKPFGIDVVVETDVGAPLSRFEIEHGESVADCIARAASFRGVMVTRSLAGQLLITRAGAHKSVAAIVSGDNVISMEPEGSDENRHSEYIFTGQGETNDYGSARAAHDQTVSVADKTLGRYLPLVTQAMGSVSKADMLKQAEHMARLRLAQAYRYTYEIEGWEANGQPWEINTLVPVFDPVLGIDGDEWLIVATEATVSRTDGDITRVTIAPVNAFKQVALPEPKAQSTPGKSGGTTRKAATFIDWRK